METTSRRIEYVPLAEVAGTDGNPKGHDLPTLVRAISVLGFTAPAVLDERTGRLIIGNGRLDALRVIHAYVTGEEVPAGFEEVFAEKRVKKALEGTDGTTRAPDGVHINGDGEWCAPIVRGWASNDDDHARAAVVADNKLTERGGWDEHALAEWLDDILEGDPELLEVTGFTRDELDDLMAALGPPPTLGELEAEYGDPADGDLWPVLRFKVPPPIRAAFYELTGHLAGDDDDDSARFIGLIEQLQLEEMQAEAAS